MQKLPIGIQTFEKIREGDYLYIDKTKIALDLIENHQNVFLSRPRRFGKSLFLDTLKNIFEAKKDFFQGLYIYDQYDWNLKYPVIKLSLGGGVLHSGEALERQFIHQLGINKQSLQLECVMDQGTAIYFQSLNYGGRAEIAEKSRCSD